MEYAVLGKTGRKVSRIGFGGATAGLTNYTGRYDPRAASDREDVLKAIAKAYELGINYFDTAPAYGDGASEEIFGEGLAGIPPEEIFLATKVVKHVGIDARKSLEDSLTRLRRDRIDLIQIHGSEYTMEEYRAIVAKGGLLDELEKAKREGLVRHIGFSIECQNMPLFLLLESGRFDVMQIHYNLLFQHPSDRSWKCGSMYDAEKAGMGIVGMRTVTSGIFQRWIQAVNPENTFDYTPSLIQFALSNDLVDVALVGMRSEDIVVANVQTCEDVCARIDLDKLNDRYAQ